MDAEFFARGFRGPTFFGHAKFENKKFCGIFLFIKSSGLWIFLVTLNLRSKNFRNFLIHRVLWMLNFLQGGSGHQLFLLMLNLRTKIFLEFFSLTKCSGLWICWERHVWALTFFVHTKFEVKKLFGISYFTECSGHWIFCRGDGSVHQLFFIMPNLTPKILRNVFLYQALWTEFFRGGLGQLFLVMPNLRPKIFWNFFLYQALWTEFFRRGSWPIFFGNAKF